MHTFVIFNEMNIQQKFCWQCYLNKKGSIMRSDEITMIHI